MHEAQIMEAQQNSQSGVQQYLTFMLDGEEYGVDILRVQEIKGWSAATLIPNMPDYVKGIINLRGTIVPVIDLRLRFGFEAKEYGATTVVIVVKIEDEGGVRTVGLVSDAVSEVYNVTDEQMKPAPDVGEVAVGEFVTGLALLDEKMVILLNVDRLVSASLLESMESAEQ